MGILQSLGFLPSLGNTSSEELPDIYPFSLAEKYFITNDLRTIYSRILTDAILRTQGISNDQESLLWDNCLGNESQDGLITMISRAMTEKSDLCIVYDKALKLIRKATSQETDEIKNAYKSGKEYSGGIFVTFKNYDRTDMLKIYSALEYCTLVSLHKSMNLSRAIQIKVSDLRASVSLTDKSAAEAQATKIAAALKAGKDTFMDGKDSIETARPDLTAANAAMTFINEKRSLYLELPESYIMGKAKTGMSDTGEGDARAVERGLKPYYYSIIKPVIEALFGASISYKSEDFYGIQTAGEMLKTFNITDDELISMENKTKVINRLFGLPENSKGDKAKPIVQPTPVL